MTLELTAEGYAARNDNFRNFCNYSVVKIGTAAQDRVARALLEHGPMTAADLAARLSLSVPAVRKHLDVLVASGAVACDERAPFGPLSVGSKGRGRPAKFFSLSAEGRALFEAQYDGVALEALRMLEEVGGKEALRRLVERRLERELPQSDELRALDVEELASKLSEHGYAAEAMPAPVGDGMQLCLRNCPIGHVAAEFPEFCEVETEVLSNRLGVRVTRLSTISSGADICTAHVPPRRSA